MSVCQCVVFFPIYAQYQRHCFLHPSALSFPLRFSAPLQRPALGSACPGQRKFQKLAASSGCQYKIAIKSFLILDLDCEDNRVYTYAIRRCRSARSVVWYVCSVNCTLCATDPSMVTAVGPGVARKQQKLANGYWPFSSWVLVPYEPTFFMFPHLFMFHQYMTQGVFWLLPCACGKVIRNKPTF
jgi:hypothetical protein